MRTPAIDPTASATPEALRGFLVECAAIAESAGAPQLVSISMTVNCLDALAVLESIFEPAEPHFYIERPAQGFSVAGAEAALEFTATGPARFAAARQFIARTLEHTIAVGPLALPFAGPHFFVAAGFNAAEEPGAPFPPLRLQVPRWQVGCLGDTTVAVANLVIAPGVPIDLVAAKVWKAHAKFRSFDYRRAQRRDRPSAPVRSEELGGAGTYPRAVAAALAEIARGDYAKVVLARALRYTTREEFHPMGVVNHLRRHYPDCYSFSIANGRGQTFVGATPERLVRVAAGRMHTTALAGSAARGESASEDAALGQGLLQSDKDLREHRLVLDAIRSRLDDLGLALETPAQPRLLSLANVHHLCTPVSAALPAGVHILDLVARLHPTPAVGGSPQGPALAAMARLEPFARGLYAGPLGWVDPRGGGEFVVGIRSALVDGRSATLYAGAGIVAGSEPASELEETDLKFKALIAALTES